VKYVASAGSLQGTHNFAEEPARYYSSEPSLQETEENGFKGHSMLAPFTAGWQSSDLHPLVIDRSEVLHSGILLFFFSLLQCSTKIFGN